MSIYDVQVKFIKNKNIDNNMLNKIALLKNEHWTYGIASQLQWMQKKHTDDDIHVLLILSEGGVEKPLAYAYLTPVNVVSEKKVSKMIGIGNVCVSKVVMHQGYGKKLLTILNGYLSDTDQGGILLCRKPVISFYEKCGWTACKYNNAFIGGTLYDNYIMFYNNKNDRYSAICIDKSF